MIVAALQCCTVWEVYWLVVKCRTTLQTPIAVATNGRNTSAAMLCPTLLLLKNISVLIRNTYVNTFDIF